MTQKNYIFIFFLTIIIFGTFQNTFAQSLLNKDRYKKEIFSEIKVTKDIRFSTNVPIPVKGGGIVEATLLRIWGPTVSANPKEHELENIDLFMDIYEPEGDTLEQRPAYILYFGGAFVSGEKSQHPYLTNICETLAKSGCVCAIADYRIGMNIFSDNAALRAVYRAVQDTRSAIRFLRADADGDNTFRVHPDHIYLLGYSAGAFSAIHNAFLDKEEERTKIKELESTFGGTYFHRDGIELQKKEHELPDQGCLDCVGDNKAYDGKANAVIGISGALGFLDLIEGSNEIPTLLFHSDDDNTVPYGVGKPFQIAEDIAPEVFGLPTVNGSKALYEKLLSVGAPVEFHSYTEYNHFMMKDINESVALDAETGKTNIVPKTLDFIFRNKLKPSNDFDIIESQPSFDRTVRSYTANAEYNYYEWEVENGTIISSNPNKRTITVAWELRAPGHTIKVTPFSNLLAYTGESTTVEIDINEILTPDDENIITDNDQNNEEEVNIATAFPNPSNGIYNISLTDKNIDKIRVEVWPIEKLKPNSRKNTRDRIEINSDALFVYDGTELDNGIHLMVIYAYDHENKIYQYATQLISKE